MELVCAQSLGIEKVSKQYSLEQVLIQVNLSQLAFNN